MEEILSENDLPVQVRYASYNVPTMESIKGVNILIFKTYVEDYLQGNCMEDSKIYFFVYLWGVWPSLFVYQI